MASHDEESKKAKTEKKNHKTKKKEMKPMKTKLIKRITSCSLFACALVCLAAAITLSTSTTARAAADAQVCSGGTLKGLYIWTFDGYADLGGPWYRKPLCKAPGSTEMVRRSMNSAR